MPIPLIAAAGVGAVGSAYAANKASKSQQRAARNQLELQKDMFDRQVDMFEPYLDSGNNALGAYMYEMGFGDSPDGYEGFTATPGYEFRRDQGRAAVEAGVGARHGLNSGAALTALERYGQNFGTQEYGNHLNRLGGLMQQGQNSAALTANAANNYAQGGSNAYADIGNARAAGAIGMGNALAGGINNGLAAWMYNQSGY